MMIPPHYMPPVAGQSMPPTPNKLSQQMQNMKLDSPALQNSGSVHNEHVGPMTAPPGIYSPQHRGHSTTVTYSGPPRATYPYNNFSSVPNSPDNNNQYTNNTNAFQSASKNTSFKMTDVNHTQLCTENGVSSGLNNLKLQNQTSGLQNQVNRFVQPGPGICAPPSLNSQNQLQTQMNNPTNVQSVRALSPPGVPRQMMNPPNIQHQQLPQSPISGPPNIQHPQLPQFPISGPPNIQHQQLPQSAISGPPNIQHQQLPQSPISGPPNMPPSPFPQTSSPRHIINSDSPSVNSLSQVPPVGYPNNQPGSPQYPGMSPSPSNSPGMWPNQQSLGASPNYPYAQPNQPMPQPQQPQKIFLDQMPSNVVVREEDKKTRNGYYTTDIKGQPPPLVTTDFIAQDRGMCNPRFIRSTVYCLPNQPDMLNQTGIPFALTVSPMSKIVEGEAAPPLALYREQGPLRCKRCKAYVCPFMTFMEGGRCFQCAFCKVVTEVPQDYFCFLDNMGERTDKFHRPELCLGSYEFLATKEYCRHEQMPNPPAYIFMIEVSNATFRNGLVPLLCENMKNVLLGLKNNKEIDISKLRVGFVTYNNVLHFYNLKKNLTQPHIMVLSDVHNAFVPLLDGFLVTLTEAEALVECLMEHIPRLFINDPATEIILGPVVQVGLEALKNANCSGKLLIFHSTIPNADAPGKLIHREGPKLLGTEKQKTVLTPQHDFYSKLAQECVTAGCAVDLFLFPSAHVDVATIAPLCRHTGGQIYKYTYFQSHVDGDQFLKDLKRNITTETAFDAVLRVRTSAGISPVFYYGNFYMSNNTDVELSALDGNKSITIEMAYDDKIPENETIHVQAALLYTTITGERRIRVHNLAIPTSVGMPDVFKCCEMDTMINYFAKQSLKLLLEQAPQQVKNNLFNRGVKILSCYRKHCATNSSSGQLILADSLKLFPLYINCLLKSDAIGGGSMISIDDKCFAMQAVNIMDVRNTAMHFYPTVLPLHDVDPDSEGTPTPIRCTVEKLNDNGAYLLENGIYMFLWIGQAISSDWLQNVFGVQSTHQVDKQRISLPELDTPLSKKISSIIEDLDKRRLWCMRMRILVQGDKMEGVFRQFLVEDRGVDGSQSYVEFLCHLHREISKNL